MPKEKPKHPISTLDEMLVRAFQNKDRERVRNLLDTDGYKLNKLLQLASGNHATFLHLAILSESLPIIKLLVERGADVFAKDSFGKTPIDVAIQKGFTEIAAYLGSRMSGKEKAAPTRKSVPTAAPSSHCFVTKDGIFKLGAGREPPLHIPMFLGSAIMLLNTSPEGVLPDCDTRSFPSDECKGKPYRRGYESWLRDPEGYAAFKEEYEKEHGR